MRTSRTVRFRTPKEEIYTTGGFPEKRDAQNRLIVPVYSEVFSSLRDNMMHTNAMFDLLKQEIDASIAPYPIDEEIVLSVYESSDQCAEGTREGAIIGFKSYICGCRRRTSKLCRIHFFTFLTAFLIGVLIELCLYCWFPNLLPEWIGNTLEIVAWAFVWQFAVYLAFEYASERKEVKRLDQILHIEYVFHHWE